MPVRPQKKVATITLAKFFELTGVTDAKLNVDSLDVQADPGMLNRFDRFTAKFNPYGSTQLRLMFLKYDNEMNGQFFAQLLKEKVLTRFKKITKGELHAQL